MADPLNFREIEDEARGKVVEAASLYIDGIEQSAGGIVTGWVLIVESAGTDGTHSISWCAGNGLPTKEQGGGLARWRVLGMMEDVSQCIRAWLTAWYVGESGDA